MAWWEFKLLRGAGYSVTDSLKGALLNKDLPSRQAEIEAERQATIEQIEKLDPEYAAKLRDEGLI